MSYDLSFNAVDFGATFNLVTIVTALVTGAMFGYYAFVPLVARLVPPSPPPNKRVFVATFIILFIIVGSIVTVYYAEQIVAELLTLNQLPWRGIGRYMTFLIFLSTFSAGVALDVHHIAGGLNSALPLNPTETEAKEEQ